MNLSVQRAFLFVASPISCVFSHPSSLFKEIALDVEFPPRDSGILKTVSIFWRLPTSIDFDKVVVPTTAEIFYISGF